MIVVSDTSVLNYLLQIGGETFLVSLFSNVVVPPLACAEMAGSPAFIRFQQLLANQTITVTGISDTSFFQVLLQSLGQGEAEAIVPAKELKADYFLVDERPDDAVAKAHGIRTIGVLGILVEAKKFGYIPLVTPYLDKLNLLANFRMSKLLYRPVSPLAGE